MAGRLNEQLEVAFTSVSVQGKVFPGERQTATLTIETGYVRAGESAWHSRPFRRPTCPPGRYQMRVAAGNKSGKAGSVVYDLQVPDFGKEAFTMSGVSLTAASAGAGADDQAQGIRWATSCPDLRPRRGNSTRVICSCCLPKFYENARGGRRAHARLQGRTAGRGWPRRTAGE
jgi:hypothetical protein